MIHGIAVKWKTKMRDGQRDPKGHQVNSAKEKDNAPSNNQPKGTKNGRPEEANLVKKQVSQ
jgi:hypothetical protein